MKYEERRGEKKWTICLYRKLNFPCYHAISVYIIGQTDRCADKERKRKKDRKKERDSEIERGREGAREREREREKELAKER